MAEQNKRKITENKKDQEPHKTIAIDFNKILDDYREIKGKNANGKLVDEIEADNFIKGISSVVEFCEVALDDVLNSSKSQSTAILTAETKKEIENVFKTQRDSGRTIILDSNIIKKLTRSEAKQHTIIKDVLMSAKDNTLIDIIDGYITPYEREIFETVAKFKAEQTTSDGQTFASFNQVYRAMRGGSKKNPKKEQIDELRKDMRNMMRFITFEVKNGAIPILNDDCMLKGGSFLLLAFDEYVCDVKGHEDIIFKLHETPMLIAISESLKMYESIPQELKRIKEEMWTATLNTGEIIKGQKYECLRQIEKKGYSNSDIVLCDIKTRDMALSKNRISLRSVIFSFVWSYLRTIGSGQQKMHSNKININDILIKCEIGGSWAEKNRAINTIYTIFDHLKNCDVLESWNTYKNNGDKNASGIQFEISKNNLISEEV